MGHGRPCTSILLLRDPLQRMLSAFNYFCAACAEVRTVCKGRVAGLPCPNASLMTWARAAAAGRGGVVGAGYPTELLRKRELRALRERAEALVAFGGISVWRTAEAMGHAQLPAQASQQLASWLSDMA